MPGQPVFAQTTRNHKHNSGDFCGGSFGGGPDDLDRSSLVLVVVDLAVLGRPHRPQPALSQTPPEVSTRSPGPVSHAASLLDDRGAQRGPPAEENGEKLH
eukprot:2852431-Pyramimonas_sp.AAC.1